MDTIECVVPLIVSLLLRTNFVFFFPCPAQVACVAQLVKACVAMVELGVPGTNPGQVLQNFPPFFLTFLLVFRYFSCFVVERCENKSEKM